MCTLINNNNNNNDQLAHSQCLCQLAIIYYHLSAVARLSDSFKCTNGHTQGESNSQI